MTTENDAYPQGYGLALSYLFDHLSRPGRYMGPSLLDDGEPNLRHAAALSLHAGQAAFAVVEEADEQVGPEDVDYCIVEALETALIWLQRRMELAEGSPPPPAVSAPSPHPEVTP